MSLVTNRITQDTFAALHNNKRYVYALLKSSANENVARHRDKEFQKLFTRSLEFQSGMKFFASGSSNFPNLGVTLNVASILSYVTSFSGFLTIERALAQANSVEYFLDLVGAVGNSRFPAVGAPTYSPGNLSRQQQTGSVPAAGGTINLNFGHAIIPRSFYASFTVTGSAAGQRFLYEIRDDGQGNLLAPDGLLAAGSSINYGTGAVQLTINPLTTAGLPTGGWTLTGAPYTLTAWVTLTTSDITNNAYPVAPNETRFRPQLTRFVQLNTFQSQIVAEVSIPDIAAAAKSLGISLDQWLTNMVATQYTIITNEFLVRRLQDAWNRAGASNVIIDLTNVLAPAAPSPISTWNAYTPVLDKLMGEMEAVNLALNRRSYRGGTTALLVSPRLYSWFVRTSLIDPANWQDEKNNFLDNLKGYYRGIPVLVHESLSAGETYNNTTGLWTTVGFAVHVTPDASLAPLVRGIFLPATALPTAINYNNISQQAMGIYFQEGVEPLAPELVQRFEVRGLPN